MNRLLSVLLAAALAQASLPSAVADTFGSGANSFEIEFVTIGNPGNPPDANPNPAGAVPYEYRIGKYEISEQMIAKANAAGGLGITTDTCGADFPATSVTWFEAARFVNWLNTSTGSVPAYKFDAAGNFQLWNEMDAGFDPANLYRNRLAKYFLPSIGQGGAIRSAATLTLRDMIIKDNHADRGAGVYLAVGGTGTAPRDVLVIEDSKFEDNWVSGHGGAAFVQFRSAGQDRVTINGSALSRNIAGVETFIGAGGALHITDSSGATANHSVAISSTELKGNEADVGGAIFQNCGFLRVDLAIQESVITGNKATVSQIFNRHGGGVYAKVTAASRIVIDDSTISNNISSMSGGGIWLWLDQSSSFAMDKSVVSGNTAENGDGGGIFARAYTNNLTPFATPRAFTVSQSVVSGNKAFDRGGGMYTRNRQGTETLIEESRFSNNEILTTSTGVHRNGGGLYTYLFGQSNSANKPRFTITRSTVNNNAAEKEGGGIFVCSKFNGDFIATNSTLSGNRTRDQSAGAGGGIIIARTNFPNESIDAYLRNVTITQNVSASGGGIKTVEMLNVRVRIGNTIISQNRNHQSAANNLVGPVVVDEFKHNLMGTGSTILDHVTLGAASVPTTNNNITSDAPGLEPLTSNGGPTPTHRLTNTSPAIDKGSRSLAKVPLSGTNPAPDHPEDNVPLTSDQRGEGFVRELDITTIGNGADGFVDIGAYEIGRPKLIEVTVYDSVVPTPAYYNFGTVVGSGEQLRTVPVGGANSIDIRFSEHVTVISGSITVQSARTGNYYSHTMSATNTSATWRLYYGAFLADQLILRVDDARVTGLGGKLDGDWTNPDSLNDTTTPNISRFPSGDNVVDADDDFIFRFTILSGDFNYDNKVNGLDYAIWRDNLGTTYHASHSMGDADGDQDVDQADYDIWFTQFGLDFTVWPT